MTARLCHFGPPVPGQHARLEVDQERAEVEPPWPRELLFHGQSYLHLTGGVYLRWRDP
jgi:hypothetical protein